ncbi:MAG: beta-ketoacyl-ACP synthase II [Puniceicoccales bacterium]|jgi:3-oxoacyl-[acyl-carrier-protein] synthase II|nr:beta-ketoacyl-ACP synthase II [Puniceicoccales bacterium]
MQAQSTVPRIVVTGIGVVSPLGNDTETFWKNLTAGVSGIERVTHFDPTDFPSQVGAEVKDFDPTKFMDGKEAKRNDRFVQLAVAASRMAFEDAGLKVGDVPPERLGVIIGSGIGGIGSIEEQSRRLFEGGPRRVSPFMITNIITNMAAGVVGIEFEARSTNYCVVSACASSAHSLGEALNQIRAGKADVMIAGGSEASIVRLGYAGFCSMKAMSTGFNQTPSKASRPFDATRDGFVMGEGSAMLILENLERAKARNAKIYAEFVGYGASCDAYHITAPDTEGRGLKLCFERIFAESGLTPADVDYINAHGTSTPYNDKFETLAIKKTFGERARQIPVSSTKSMTGHLLGAAGGLEAAASVLAIRDGIIPPTINYENPDPECDLDYVPNAARKHDVKVALSNNLGFGGHNAVLAFKRFTA